MPRPIDLTEYADSEPLRLTALELEAASELIPSLTIKPAVDGQVILNPGGIVGVGEVGERRITIRPKMGIRRLMFLIAYSLDAVRWRENMPALSEAPDLLEAVVPAYVAAIERATARGVLRGYEERTDALSTVRGRLSFDLLIKRRFGVFPPIDCQFDDYTADIEMNRLLLAATQRLVKMHRVTESWGIRLRALRGLFAEVSSRRYRRTAIPRISYTRLTRHYQPAVELARLILRDLSVELGSPSVRARGFFVNVAEVFEDFVVVALREALGVSERQFPQEAEGRRLYLDRGQRLVLKPDISWWDGSQCRVVADVKYKRTPASIGVLHPDVYQLLSYTSATRLDRGMLIYAAGEADEATYEVPSAGKTIDVRTLNLDADPEDVLGQIGTLGRTLRAWHSDARLAEAPPSFVAPHV